MRRWFFEKAQRVLHWRNLRRSSQLRPFQACGELEVGRTLFAPEAKVNRKLMWTPAIQRREPSRGFIEHLEDLREEREMNIFTETKEHKVELLVEAFLSEAFSPEEKATLNIARNFEFAPSPKSPFRGRAFYFIQTPGGKKNLAIFLAERSSEASEQDGFYPLNENAPLVFFDYFLANYEVESVSAIITNGHAWQMFEALNRLDFKRSKRLQSVEGLIFEDTKIIEGILGMIRYPLLRTEAEFLLDRALKINDSINTQKK